MKTGNFIEKSILGAISFLKESIFSEEYATYNGLLQSIDPRIKLLSILLLLLAVLFAKSLYLLAVIYAFALMLTVCSSIRLGFFLKRTWLFIPLFSLFIAVPALFDLFTPGETVFRLRILSLSFNITRQGILSASFFFMRVLTSVSLCVLLVLTTRNSVLLKVLRIFKVPQVFVMTLGMCYRYIYLFIIIIQDTYLAIKSRVGVISSVRKGQGIVAWNIASLWQRSYQMNEDVYKAMLSRGYHGEPVILNEFKTKPKDWLWLFVSVLISSLVFYLG